jgi:hypothetical protein
MSSEQQKVLFKPSLRTDEFVKKFLLRDLRSCIKNTYNYVYGNSRHYQCQESLMRDLRNFWTGRVFQTNQDDFNQRSYTHEMTRFYVPEEYYDLHESVFFKLIFNTKDLKEYGLQENQTTRAMDNIFCNNFNMKEFEKFL